MLKKFLRKESVSILGYVILVYLILKESDLLIYKICAFLIAAAGIINLYYGNQNKPLKTMNDKELNIVKPMISNDENEASIIKRIREYTNLDIVKAKQFYDELK